MKPIFVDTGFLIALINPRDALHQKANALSLKYEGVAIVTTDAVLLELGNALSRSYKEEASGLIHTLQNSDDAQIIYSSSDLFAKGLQLYEKYQDKTWGLVDCISFVVMKELGITDALTFDQHFEQAGFVILED